MIGDKRLILITGATGFLGRNLCHWLVSRGYTLRALVRQTSDTSYLEPLGIELVTGDITDANSVRAAIRGCGYVVHTAAHFRLWGPPEPFILTNIEGTRNVLDEARVSGIKKFIHISTIVVVGPQSLGTIITEETPYGPYRSDNYAKTKMIGEKLAQSYSSAELPVVILRLGALYGPHGHYAFNRLFFEEYLHNWRVQVHEGCHIVSPCFVCNAARGIELALIRGRPGEIYNLSDKSLTHREANHIISRLAHRSNWRVNVPAPLILLFVRLLELVAKITNREPFYPLNLAPYVFDDWIVDSTKAQQELGFRSVSFRNGAQQTLLWYQSIGYQV